jgi:hypothetical protein
MTKLGAFVKLDFVTVKPYMTPKNFMIYAAVALFVPMMTGQISMACGIGMMLAVTMTSYPFALGEKANMDALYPTLGVDRRTVVLGRYIFTIVMNVIITAAAIAVAAAGMAVMGKLTFESGEILLIVISLMVVFMIVQAIQIVFYFKMGYTKAKFFSTVPFVVILIGSFAFSALTEGNTSPAVSEFVSGTLASPLTLAAAVILFLCLVVFVSYTLSLRVYSRREF